MRTSEAFNYASFFFPFSFISKPEREFTSVS